MTFDCTRADFPEGFNFGVSTAAYQIEGTSFGTCGPTHWDTFAKGPGNVFEAQDGSVACAHMEHWEADLDLIAAGGFDSYRFSTSMARVVPDGRTANPEGLDFYDRLVDGMLARGLQPNLTLYHWDLPSALADVGGWMNADLPDVMADYARIVMARIGDRVTRTATINEPWCVSFLSHFLGHHAPGLKDIRAAARSMHFVLLAHARMVEAMRADGHSNLGMVPNFAHIVPASDSDADVAAAARIDAINNQWFIGAVTHGSYPAEALEGLEPHLPEGWQDDLSAMKGTCDWIGLNYYTRNIIAADSRLPWPAAAEVKGPLPKTDMDWEIYPEGLEAILNRLHRDYTGDMPLYVTENGMAGADRMANSTVADLVRVDYFRTHLAACRRAIAAGVPLKGYFAWSLLDNYEWAFGYDKRFGIVHVDYDTQVRTPKDSYRSFQALLT